MASPIRSRKDSEDDDEIMFDGPTTKQEVMSWLNYYNLLLPEYLEPLASLQNTDTLDEDLLTRYSDILRFRIEENNKIDNSISDLEKYFDTNKLDSLTIEDSLEMSLNDESQWIDIIHSSDDSCIIPADSCGSKTEVKCDVESTVAIKVGMTEIIPIITMNEIIDLTTNDSLEENRSSDSIKNDENVSVFNDTLEEMEMLMKYGENYMKIEDEFDSPKEQTNANFCSSGDENNKENVVKVCDNSAVKLLENENEQQRLVSSLSANDKMNILNSKTPQKSPQFKQRREFKIPIHIPLSARRKSPNFKNIMSPVSLYIKNSPQVPLVHKISAATNQVGTFREPNAPNLCEKLDATETPSGLPTLSYKPSPKNIFISKEAEPSMPVGLRKLIKGRLGPEIIKHVGRINDSEDLPTTSAQTDHNDAELTILSSTNASESNSRDVSLYISKNSIKK